MPFWQHLMCAPGVRILDLVSHWQLSKPVIPGDLCGPQKANGLCSLWSLGLERAAESGCCHGHGRPSGSGNHRLATERSRELCSHGSHGEPGVQRGHEAGP